MAARKKKTEKAEIAPAIIAIPSVDSKALSAITKFADQERRSSAATTEAERALLVLVRSADEIVQQAGDIDPETFGANAIERERYAKKINRLADSIEKVRIQVVDLLAA
jgi:hypothetical protein